VTHRLVVGLDGHDGAGKSTLAEAVARRLGGIHLQPFTGSSGRRLLVAAKRGDIEQTLRIGEQALQAALDVDAGTAPLVLDRSWVTVASLVPWPVFQQRWRLWIPTIVCWADLDTTLERLRRREESGADREWHQGYIVRYREIAADTATPVLVTTRSTVEQSIADVLALATKILQPPGLPPVADVAVPHLDTAAASLTQLPLEPPPGR
jgi:cytidylate kinase